MAAIGVSVLQLLLDAAGWGGIPPHSGLWALEQVAVSWLFGA